MIELVEIKSWWFRYSGGCCQPDSSGCDEPARRHVGSTPPVAAARFDIQLAVGERYGWPTIERTLAMAVAKFHPELVRDKTGPSPGPTGTS
ncbi:hypothetical protein ACLM5J_17300, partial [Nocardioides sp. Bht2]